MPVYRYTAKEKTGRTVNGRLEASDEKALIGLLRTQQLVIISIAEDKKKEGFSIRSFGKRIKLSELVLFSRQLATLIDSGIPLVQGLEMIAEQLENPAFKSVVTDIKRDIAAGLSFHESLAKHPRVFSGLFVNMVKAGESSGALDDIMDRLATYLEKTDSLNQKVKMAMVYPAVVTVMAVIITLIMMLKVVPVFKAMFADFGGQLPLPTRVLIFISDLLIHTFFIWTGLLIAGIFLLKRFIKTELGSLRFDQFKLRLPVFGLLQRKVAISKFSRTLSTLVKSGVPILAALDIVGKTAGNKVIEGALDQVRRSVREGTTLAEPLLKTKVFPTMVVRMIAVGEQTGELEKMLLKIADFYDDQVNTAVSGLTSIIEPLIIAFLGIVIGAIVICMFLPIFKISGLVQA